MNDSASILIVDDEERVRLLLRRLIEKDGYECHTASSGVEALSALRENDFSVVLADLHMPKLDGIGLLSAIKEAGIETVSIVLTGRGDVSSAVKAMKLGAYDFLSKPITDSAAFCRLIAKAVEHARVLRHSHLMERIAAEWEMTFDASPDMMAILDKKWRVVRCNQAMADRLGISKNERVGRHCGEIWGRAMCPAEGCPCTPTLSDGTTHRREVHSDAFASDFLVTTSPLRNGDGQTLGMLYVARDITPQKQLERTLAETSAQTRLIIDTALDAFVAMDAHGLIVDWNLQAEATFGWRRDEVLGRPLAETIIPPRFRAAHCQGLGRFLTTGESRAINQRTEVMALHRDGHEFPVELAISPPLPKGQTLIFNAFLHDISQRKQAERQLRLQATVMEAAANAIVITDRTGQIQWVNPAFTQMTGYSAEEAVGATPRLLKSGAHDPSFYQQLWQTILAGQIWHGEIVNRRKDGSLYVEEQTITPVRDESGEIFAFLSIKQDITQRKRMEQALREAHAENEQLLLALPSILIGVNADGTVTHWNRIAEEVFYQRAADVIGRPFYEVGIPWNWNVVRPLIEGCRRKDQPTRLHDLRFTRADGKEGFVGMTVNPIKGDTGEPSGAFLLLGADITQHRILESQLAQSQKLESIGRLAAGIAHEINTPTQYVGDNTRFLQDAFGDITTLLEKYDQLLKAVKENAVSPELMEEVEAAAQTADVEYLVEEIPLAIRQSLEGVERVAKIVRAMKEFSHPGVEEKTPIDLNQSIESTITVARNEWKYVADMETDFDPNLPLVTCLPGDLNQVFLNMIVNSAHAIADVVGDGVGGKGTITISTRHVEDPRHQGRDWAEVRISDTGTGIPQDIIPKIFDPFFTTKQVGKGTGQGLAISYNVVVEKHGGTIDVESEVGKGTTFIIRLPISEVNGSMGQ